jgi:hypothetical protein
MGRALGYEKLDVRTVDDAGAARHVITRKLAGLEIEYEERPFEWTEPTGCDAWILPIWEADALAHAAIWNDYLVDRPDELRGALDRWTDYLGRLGARHVSEGAIVLHKRRARRNTVRVDSVDEDELDEAGDQIRRAFAARVRLSELRRAGELLDEKLTLAAPLLLEHEIEPQRGRSPRVSTRLEIGEGTHSVVEGPRRVLELIASLDGNGTLGELVRTTAARLDLSAQERARLERAVVKVARELLELGALSFA